MEDASIELKLGSVTGIAGEIRLSVVVNADGGGWVQAFVSPTFGRGNGVLLRFGEETYEALKAKLRLVDETIERVRSSGMLKALEK